MNHEGHKLDKWRREVLTEDGVGGVPGGLVHGCLSDEPLVSGKRDAGRREAAALVVGDDLAAVAPPHGHARVRRPEVDSDRRTVALHGGRHLRNQICEAKAREVVLRPQGVCACVAGFWEM